MYMFDLLLTQIAESSAAERRRSERRKRAR